MGNVIVGGRKWTRMIKDVRRSDKQLSEDGEVKWFEKIKEDIMCLVRRNINCNALYPPALAA